jgi:PA14 domain
LAQGDSFVAGASGPTATFQALNICFPSCNGSANDGSSLASYIATNGTNLSGSSTLGDAVTRYSGFLAIPTAGTYTFGLFSDDGSVLQIGGTTIVIDDGLHGVTGSSTAVTFGNAGLYSLLSTILKMAAGQVLRYSKMAAHWRPPAFTPWRPVRSRNLLR